MTWLGELSEASLANARGGAGWAAPSWVAEHAGALARAGLRDVVLELHGPVAAAHEQVTRSAIGSGPTAPFDATLAAIDHARSHGVGVLVVSDASRSGMRVLRELGGLVARLGVRGWCLRAPWRAPELIAPQQPRAALCMPFMLDAAVRARAAGIEAWIAGAPLCLMGPHHPLALPARGAAIGPPCDGCPAHPRCEGLGPRYREAFGVAELRPIASVEGGAPTPIAAIFREALVA